MFTVALMIIVLLADHSEAVKCYECSRNGKLGNCNSPKELDCAAKHCVKLTREDGDFGKSCSAYDRCPGFSSGCKTYKLYQIIEADLTCGIQRAANLPAITNIFPTEGKGSANNSESRQEQSLTADAELCLCSEDLCNKGTVSVKMTTAGVMILMMIIAVATKTVI